MTAFKKFLDAEERRYFENYVIASDYLKIFNDTRAQAGSAEWIKQRQVLRMKCTSEHK